MGILCRNNEELQEYLKKHRAEGKKIVSTNGCFDILSYAHVLMLQEAKAQGDILVVGLNSDDSIRKLKGPKRPIRPENERAGIMAALACVDYVILFDEKDCIDFVARVAPDVHVNDASYGENCIEAPTVKACGGRLHLVQKFNYESNTNLLNRIYRDRLWER